MKWAFFWDTFLEFECKAPKNLLGWSVFEECLPRKFKWSWYYSSNGTPHKLKWSEIAGLKLVESQVLFKELLLSSTYKKKQAILAHTETNANGFFSRFFCNAFFLNDFQVQ